jgi:putative membrane protein insertion efficiency factor
MKVFMRVWSCIRKILAFIVLLPVYLYRIFVSPLVGHSCKYEPTCSQYMIDAVRKRGIIVGMWLGIKRICRCNPWNKNAFGYDPVPEKAARKKESEL